MILAVLLAPLTARGADALFAGALPPGQLAGPPMSVVSAQFGGTWSSGNASGYLVTSGVSAERRWARNRVSGTLTLNLGRARVDSNGNGHLDDAEREATPVETARRSNVELRYDRYVGTRDSVYAMVGTLADPFAGFDQRMQVQAGLSRTLLRTRASTAVVEVGAHASHEDRVPGIEPATLDVYSVRATAKGTHRFNEAVSAQGQIEVLESVLEPDDVRVATNAALVATLTGSLDVRLSTQISYDNVPVEGFVPLDQVTLATLVASFR